MPADSLYDLIGPERFFWIVAAFFTVFALIALYIMLKEKSFLPHISKRVQLSIPPIMLLCAALIAIADKVPGKPLSVLLLFGYYPIYVLVPFIIGMFILSGLRVMFSTVDDPPAPQAKTPQPQPEPMNRRDFTEAVMKQLQLPPQLVDHFREAVYTHAEIGDPKELAEKLKTYKVPAHTGKVGKGVSLRNYAADWYAWVEIPQPLREALDKIEVELVVPDHLRTQHMHVVATTGFGKSQLFQSMILNDLTDPTQPSLVVIDSQNDLINTIAPRVDPARLILIDPVNCPPIVNPFNNPKHIEDSVELMEYVFAALGAGMTSKQTLVYRNLARLLLIIPGADLNDMVKLLQEDGTAIYSNYIEELGTSSRAFFQEFGKPKQNQYAETKQEVLRRLLTALENPTFEQMLTGSSRLDVESAVNSGKVILVSTAKNHLKSGAALLGRMFIAQTIQAVMHRPQGNRRRTYLYLDEFQDYAEDTEVLYKAFEQSRKYELGMVAAHQSLAQLPDGLRPRMAATTAIKFAGGVSAEDRANLARQMDVDPEFIGKTKRGTFAAWFRDMGAVHFPVEFGRLEKVPELQSLPTIYKRMRERYGPLTTPEGWEPPPRRPPEKPKKEWGNED